MELSHAPGQPAAEGHAGRPHGLRPFDEARREDTPGHRLRELAVRAAASHDRSEREQIEEAVAANPNAPPDLLAELAPKHWRAFFRNPAAPLLLLEAPDFLDRLTPAARGGLLRLTGVPDWMLRFFAADAHDPLLALEAKLHHGLTGEIGKEWEPRLRSILRRVAGLTGPEERQAQAEMAEIGLAPSWVAGPEPVPVGYLGELPAVGPLLADLELPLLEVQDPETTPDRLNAIADEAMYFQHIGADSLPFWVALVQNPRTPQTALATALKAWSRRRDGIIVRRAIAAHPNTGGGLIGLLLDDPDAATRRSARSHPRASKDATALCRPVALREALRPATPDQRPSLCRMLALLHSEASEAALKRAEASPLWLDRLGAALRTRDSLATLANDGNAFVRAAARARRAAGKTVFVFEL